MKENEELMKKYAGADSESKVLFITGSGTASMEAVIMNVFNCNDKVLIVNGGSFSQRFVDICSIHDIPYTEIKLDYGKILTKDKLEQYDDGEYTGLLVNVHEKSTGALYDLNMISDFCKKIICFW